MRGFLASVAIVAVLLVEPAAAQLGVGGDPTAPNVGLGTTVAPSQVSPANPFGNLNVLGIDNARANQLTEDQKAEMAARCRVITADPNTYGAFATATCLTYGGGQ